VENQLLKVSHLIQLFLFIIILIATIIGFLYKKRIGFYSIFTILTSFALTQLIVSNYLYFLYGAKKSLDLINLSINIFLIIELFIISVFFYSRLKSENLKKIITYLNGPLWITLFIILIIDSNYITVHYGFFASTEAIIILLNCIFLFIEILDDDSDTSLSDSPDFIITAGYFFFFSFTCPFYMLYSYIKYSNPIFLISFYIINDLGYLILYFLITKAYLCQIRINKL